MDPLDRQRVRLDGIGVVLAALLVAVLAGWLINLLLPHLWLSYIWTR